MCSTHPQRIAEIGKAIDDLAAAALAAYAPAERRPAHADGRPGQGMAAGQPGTDPGPGAELGRDAEPGPASTRPDRPLRAAGLGDVNETDQVVIRLAQLWALLAELDPEVARRLPRYQA